MGQTITVQVSYIDGGGTTETLTATPTTTVANINDAPTGLPTISGTPTQGGTLRVDTAAIRDADGTNTFTYQWQGGGNDISGATDTLLVLTQAQVGQTITVQVSYIDGGGTTETLTATPTTTVANINDAPTGLPTISGTPTQGGTLRVDTAAIRDADGTNTFTYQWQGGGNDISGATDTLLVLTQAQVGQTITVQVSYIDGGGTTETLTATPTTTVANINDAPTGLPTISGTPTQGGTLRVDTAAIRDADGTNTFTYQWQGGGNDISGATDTLLVLTQAQVGQTITVQVSYIDGGGTTETLTATPTTTVANINDAPTGLPTISGTPTQGGTLRVDTAAIRDADGTNTFTYQWQGGGNDISGATDTLLVLTQAQVGQTITVQVSYIDGGGTTETLTATPTTTVANINDAPTGLPTISGTPTQGGTLRVDTAAIRDADGTNTFTYQWQGGGNDISGATDTLLVLTQAQVGQTITVQVSYIDGGGTTETLTATPTTTVANINDAPTGLPTISGTPTQGGTLRVDTAAIRDADGTNTFTYQWQGGGNDISGATDTLLVLTQAQVGQTITVQVSYIDGGGTTETLTATPTTTVANINDAPTGLPTISGTPTQGGTLRVDTAAIRDADGTNTFTYQWQGGGNDISGATDTLLVLTQAQVGQTITVQVSYIDGGGTTETLTATPTTTVANINDAPTGLPTISGTPTQGGTLRVDTAAIRDADGTNTFTYQWQGGGNDISGATDTLLVLTQAQVGQTITVQVSYIDGGGTTETLTATPTTTVANINDAPTGLPTISGTPTQGGTLRVDTAAIRDADGTNTFTYQWQGGGNDISGATDTLLVLTQAQVGQTITVQVSYIDGGGTTETLTATPTTTVANINDAPTGLPTISGTPTQGGTLRVDTAAIRDADGTNTFTYQWQGGGNDISGATDTLLVLMQAEVGQTITVQVSYIDGGGTTETLTATPTTTVANINDAPTGLPTISGTPTQGGTLRVDTAAIRDADGTNTFTYQWQGGGNDISGATDTLLVLTQAQVGQTITVQVSYIDGGGTTETLTATPTTTVANINDAPTGLPTISGTPTQGGTLRVDTAAIRDADGTNTFTYQWLGAGVTIGGASSSTFVLTQVQVGQTMTVRVGYTDQHNTTETLTATPTSTVTNINDAPTGLPAISGTPTQGGTLRVDTAAIRDADGTNTFTYQWQGGGNDISGATDTLLVLMQAEVGQTITVQVSYIDGGGTTETLTATPTTTVANINDAPTGLPTISGTPTQGGTLRVDTAAIRDADGTNTFTYQWQGGGNDISGATDTLLVLMQAEVGQTITVQVSYIDGGGTTETLTATPTTTVANINDAPTGLPTISGTPTQGGTLRVDTAAIRDADGTNTFTYQWQGGGNDISGATDTLLVLTQAQVGQTITVQVSYIDGGGTTETLTATPTTTVANINDAPTGLPTISGTPTQGGTLRVDTAAIRDADGTNTFTYQWQGGGNDISGATDTLLVLMQAEVGQTITVQVSYIDGGGTTETLTATPTTTVANINDAPTGLPTISGTPTQGGTLRVDTAAIRDADGTNTFTYQWQGGGNDISGATDTLLVLMQAEVGQTITVQVSYIDGGDTTETLAATPTSMVANINDAPTGLPTITGTPISGYTLSADTSTIRDADGTNTFTYQWLGGGREISYAPSKPIDPPLRDRIRGAAGEIGGATSPTFVLTQAQVGQTMTVRVRYIDGGGTTETLTAIPTDAVSNDEEITGSGSVDEAPTITSSTFTIAENAGDGATVGTITGTATEMGTTLTYSITAGNAGNAFALDSATGVITVNGENILDYETTPFYSLTVSVSDGSLTATATVGITVTDINEAPTITGTTTFTIAEDATNSATVGTLTGVDADKDTLTYSITAGNSGDAFAIGSATGVIMVSGDNTLDYETTPSYSLTVAVSDGSLTATATVGITVTDINEAPTITSSTFTITENATNSATVGTITGSTFTIAENADDGATVGTLTGDDADKDTLTYSITAGNAGNAFALDSATGVITVNGENKLDYETTPFYSLTVTVSDGSLTATATVGITVTDINEAPTITGTTTFTIAEDATNSATVGTITGDDADKDTLTYSMTVGNSGDAFALDSATGVITVNGENTLDYETTPSYSLTVAVSDGSLTATATVTINVTNVNEAPTITGTTTFTIAEDATRSATVGIITGVDADKDTLTYSMTVGNSGDAFALDSATGVITVSGDHPLDYETTPSYSLTVAVSDGSLTATATVTINVTNVNEAPTITGTTTFTIAEDATRSATVGIITGVDADKDTLTYSMTAGHAGVFALDSTTGVITVSGDHPLDYETTPSYSLTVAVSDGSLTATATVTINVTNVNEAPTITGTTTFTIAEDATHSATVGTLTGVDADKDTLTYSMTAGHAGVFALDSTTGVITVSGDHPLDYETTPSYSLTVAVSDGSLTATATVTINVTNVNEAPTITGTTTFTIAEDATRSATVGIITGVDADKDTLTYSMTVGNSGDAFALDSATGVITVNGENTLDYETTPSYSLTVAVSDGSLTATATVTINVTNVNEAPTITGTTTFTIAEDATRSATVGIITGVDADKDTLTYSMTVGNSGDAFALDSATGVITVNGENTLDYETTPSYSLTVAVSDGSLTATATVTINVTNVNEAPTITGTTTFTIAEDATHSATVGTLTGVDADKDTLTYSMTAGHAGVFALDSTTGVITVSGDHPLDYETTPSYSLTVAVSDGSLTATATVTINVTNVNEAPTITGTTTFTIAEDATRSATVGIITGVDADKDTLTYSMTVGNSGDAFALDSATGVITVNGENTLDYETTPSYSLTVAVSDGSLTATATVTINVTNVNEAPTITGTTTFTIAEDATRSATVGIITGVDADKDTLTYSMTAGHAGVFALDSTTGVITVSGDHPLDYETTPSYSLTVAVSDGSLTATAAVTINVTNVNEAPTITGTTTFTIAEDATHSATVGTLTGVDADKDTLTYSMTAGHAGVFALDSTTGVITVSGDHPLDYETTPSYSLTVAVSDGSLTATATVTINVTNVNEAPTITGTTTFTIAEDATRSATVGIITGVDADKDTLTYSMTVGNSGDAFALDSATGVITVNGENTLDYETTPSYSLTVAVSDGSLTATATVTINVTNVNEAPTITGTTTFTIAEDATR